MKAIEVFTPGELPTYTYIDRAGLELGDKLRKGLGTPGYVVSVSGPSKSGKTVLCETVIGKASILLVTGGGISEEGAFWQRIRQLLKVPKETEEKESRERTTDVKAKLESGLGVPGLAETKAGLETGVGTSHGRESSQVFDELNGLPLLEYLKSRSLILVVDDFHYISKTVQRVLAEQFKEAARKGSHIVVISVNYRSDESLRALPELKGRVLSIEIPFWKEEELRKISEVGFPLLNIKFSPTNLDFFSRQSLTSPQLMQAICLECSRQVGAEESLAKEISYELKEEEMDQMMRSTVAIADCKTSYTMLSTGPKPRGQERKEYKMVTGESKDVYHIVLAALTIDPPMLELSYDQLKNRIGDIVIEDTPSGASISEALEQMQKTIEEKLQNDRVLDWEDNRLALPDPYFLHYLRWQIFNKVRTFA